MTGRPIRTGLFPERLFLTRFLFSIIPQTGLHADWRSGVFPKQPFFPLPGTPDGKQAPVSRIDLPGAGAMPEMSDARPVSLSTVRFRLFRFSGGPVFIKPAMTPSGMNRPYAVAHDTAGDLFPFPCRANRPDGLPLISEWIYRVQTGAAQLGKAALFCPAMSQRRLRPEKARQARPEKPRLFSARSRPKKFPAVSRYSFLHDVPSSFVSLYNSKVDGKKRFSSGLHC